MADIVRTAAQVGAIYSQWNVIVDVEAGAAIAKGQPCYINTSGKADLADASAAGTAKLRGLALKAGAAGDTVPLLEKGAIEGFAVSALNGDAAVFLSDTAGELADAAGTVSKIVGAVFVLPGTGKKVIMVDIPWNIQT